MNILTVFTSGQLMVLFIVISFFIWTFLLNLTSNIKDCILYCNASKTEDKEEETDEQ